VLHTYARKGKSIGEDHPVTLEPESLGAHESHEGVLLRDHPENPAECFGSLLRVEVRCIGPETLGLEAAMRIGKNFAKAQSAPEPSPFPKVGYAGGGQRHLERPRIEPRVTPRSWITPDIYQDVAARSIEHLDKLIYRARAVADGK
jgi:hypothetical protein